MTLVILIELYHSARISCRVHHEKLDENQENGGSESEARDHDMPRDGIRDDSREGFIQDNINFAKELGK